jgi:hypothetical protein
LSISQLSNGEPTAEKAEIVQNGNGAETFLSTREPNEKPGGLRNLRGFSESTVCNRTFQMKGRAMNTQIQTSEQLTKATHGGTGALEMDGLTQRGFTAKEIVALLWLRGWYQSGGSDRMELVRHWEFLKWLVVTGKLSE